MVAPKAEMATRQRCMVLYGKSLLAQGVAYLLTADRDMEVFLVNTEEVDPVEAMRSIKPNVLILDINNLEDLGGFLTRLLREHPTTKIVGVDSLDSTIYILQPRQRVVGSAKEFRATLREGL